MLNTPPSSLLFTRNIFKREIKILNSERENFSVWNLHHGTIKFLIALILIEHKLSSVYENENCISIKIMLKEIKLEFIAELQREWSRYKFLKASQTMLETVSWKNKIQIIFFNTFIELQHKFHSRISNARLQKAKSVLSVEGDLKGWQLKSILSGISSHHTINFVLTPWYVYFNKWCVCVTF